MKKRRNDSTDRYVRLLRYMKELAGRIVILLLLRSRLLNRGVNLNQDGFTKVSALIASVLNGCELRTEEAKRQTVREESC